VRFAIDDNSQAVVGCTAVNAVITRSIIYAVVEGIISPHDVVEYDQNAWRQSVPRDVGCWLTGYSAIQPTRLDHRRVTEIDAYFRGI